MQQFIAKYQKQIYGVISGFDRLVLRGSPRRLIYPQGMEEYLWQNGVLCKDYQQHVKKISERVKKASLAPFCQNKLPVIYLSRGSADKEQIARSIAAERASGPGGCAP
jgi:hypothetical protein